MEETPPELVTIPKYAYDAMASAIMYMHEYLLLKQESYAAEKRLRETLHDLVPGAVKSPNSKEFKEWLDGNKKSK